MRPIKPTDDQDFNFDKQFRDNLRNMEVTPPAGLWDQLEGNLDQQREQVKYNHWYYAAIALLLFFAGFNAISAFDVEEYYAVTNGKVRPIYTGTYLLAGQHPSQVAGIAHYPYLRINKSIDYSFEDSEPLVTVSSYGQNRYFTPYIGTNASKAMYGSTQQGNGNMAASKNRLALASNSLPTLELQTPTNPLLIAYAPKEQLLDGEVLAISLAPTPSASRYEKSDIIKPAKHINPMGHIKGFYVGAEYVFTGTRMFQKNSAFYPLLGKDAEYSFQKGYQYGVKAGYHFNHRMALELGWIINSAQGQQYSDNLYGKIPVKGNIDLTYTQVPLLFKYKFAHMSGITKQPVSLNIITGLAYSRLKASSMQLNDARIDDISDMVTRNELGVILGLEYDIYLHKNLFVTFGGRAGYFTDTETFKGLEKNAPRLHNFTMGVSAAIHYQLPKRKAPGKVEY